MPHSENVNYEFGPYRLNLADRHLTRAGETIYLTPKATEILVRLVMNAGQLLDRDDLLREVWPNTFVEESNLTQNIFALRRALGDEWTEPKFIETVARRGYRFVATTRICNGDEDKCTEVEAVDGDGVELPIVIAVLPFINTTGDMSVEYLAEGVTDNIINNLSRVSRLRVMSRSAVFRHKRHELDPQMIGKDLGAATVLVGTIDVRPAGIAIGVELVDVATGWQLWGESFDTGSKDLLEIQDAITRQLLVNLKLKLTGEEEKRVTARYTENASAYQAYLEGRYHWSRYTRKGIEKAIGHFRQAIELDPNYALAYAGIVDCYLRLATNYLPPEDETGAVLIGSNSQLNSHFFENIEERVKLRFEWDWRGAERELRRACELKIDYPAVHQWYAAYKSAVALYNKLDGRLLSDYDEQPTSKHLKQLSFVSLTPNEEVQILCTVAREQLEVGNYNAGCHLLGKWWTPGELPRLVNLRAHSAADLLFTAGALAGCLSSTGSLEKGQKQAESLLSGAVGLFEHIGAKRQSAECRIELALSYYRQGMFELARAMLLRVLTELEPQDTDLKSLALIRLAVVERHAGLIQDSLSRLAEAHELVEQNGPLLTGRYHHELATALKDSAIAENRSNYSDEVSFHFRRAVYEFVAIGHHRYAAVVENNHGYLLLNLGLFNDAESHLQCARTLFDAMHDKIRRAQVDDTLAQLYVVTERLDLAREVADRAIAFLEEGDEDALLAEALRTKGTVLCKLNRHAEARGVLEAARRIAERCGDSEGAGKALLLTLEHLWRELEDFERQELADRMRKLLKDSQLASVRFRLQRCLDLISLSREPPKSDSNRS